jgi:hypothetical protein
MTYSDLLDALKEQELQGKCGMVVDQATNLAIMPPSALLSSDRAVLSPMEWIKPKPFDFTKYWHISGSEAILEQLKAMRPGQSKEVEYCMFRVPCLVDGEWYADLCRYHQVYYCVDLGYTQARVSSSDPGDYELVRPATKAEVDALRQP